MMTNQEALLTFRAGFSCLDVSLEEVINTIQLDAFKAGAEWAAQIADEVNAHQYVKEEILSASSNLKEIPK